MKKMFFFITVIALFFVMVDAVAEKDKDEDEDEENVVYKYKRKTTVKFDEVELEGAFQKPEGYYSLKAKKTKFDALITPRYDFMDELKNSVFTIDEE